MSDKRDPWERRDDETDKAFAAFVAFRDLPPGERTDVAAYAKYQGLKKAKKGKVPAPSWYKWKKENLWDQRVALHDAWVDSGDLEATAEKRKEVKGGLWAAIGLMSKRLKALAPNLEAGQLASNMRASVDVLKYIDESGGEGFSAIDFTGRIVMDRGDGTTEGEVALKKITDRADEG